MMSHFTFLKIVIPYFIDFNFFAFNFGWVDNNNFFCGVINSEHTINIDFTWTWNGMLIQ